MNKDEIIKMLEYSGISYNDSEFFERGETIYNINDKVTDVSYQIRIEDDMLTIAFRGSDSKKDWNFNLNFLKKVVPYGNNNSKIKIHSGFLNAYKSDNVRGKIRNFLNKKIRKVRITGHSYGAALAIICAVDLQYSFNDKDYEVVVFGSPRVGNRAFRDSYNKRIFKTIRVENVGDIVTKLPFGIMGYYHVGGKLVIGKNKYFKFPSMRSHYLQEYYSNIWDV